MENVYKPILFSTPMVLSILENRKNQTRRTKGLEKLNERDDILEIKLISDTDKSWFLVRTKSSGTYRLDCPYQIGDILWVRETFVECNFKSFWYKATHELPGDCWKWKPSIFMPKKAARIFLKVKSVKVERLQDINNSDAIAEGVYEHPDGGFMNYLFIAGHVCAQHSFESLWRKINGRDSWTKNPFVWVIEFERIDKPLDFIV
ncbi:MAG: hypothetical protein ABI441_03750 [Flavobacterium sp.]